MLRWVRSTAIPQILLKLTNSLRYVLFVGKMFPRSNVAGTQMLEVGKSLKGFLPKPMYLKYNDKGQTKMHPGVPEYILYIYIYV